MSKLELQAIFERKASNFKTDACVVEQIVRLPGREFDFFRNNLLRDYDFIRDNIEAMYRETDKTHCLLVVGEDRKDGVLVESSGYAYARYAAFIPNAADILERYQEREASVPTAAEQDFSYWTAVTESSRFQWTEDEVTRLNGRGAMYYIGGEDGHYMQIDTDGRLTAGTYEGAIPHIGDAMFQPEITKEFPDFNAAFTAMLEAGGKKFLADMFSGKSIPRPQEEKKSVLGKIQEARLTPTPPKKQRTPKKETPGAER